MRTAPLNIKVVYSATGRRRGGHRTVSFPRPARPAHFALLGLLNLAAAGSLYYAIWWRVDRYLYLKLMLTTPLPGVDAEAAGGFLVPRVREPRQASPAPPEPRSVNRASIPKATWADKLPAAAAYVWLTLATVGTCALAVAAGTSLARVSGVRGRRAGQAILLGAVIGLGWYVYAVWDEYGVKYPPNSLRTAMGGLLACSGCFGLAVGRGVHAWNLAAASSIILSAITGVGGLVLARANGAVKPDEFGPPFVVFLGLLLVVHSLWGWALLFANSRLGK